MVQKCNTNITSISNFRKIPAIALQTEMVSITVSSLDLLGFFIPCKTDRVSRDGLQVFTYSSTENLASRIDNFHSSLRIFEKNKNCMVRERSKVESFWNTGISKRINLIRKTTSFALNKRFSYF